MTLAPGDADAQGGGWRRVRSAAFATAAAGWLTPSSTTCSSRLPDPRSSGSARRGRTPLPVPTFADVLDELGGRAVMCPGAKNIGAARAIVDQLAHRGLVDAAIVQSFIQAELLPAVAAGAEAMLLTAPSVYDPAAVHAAGIRYLGLSATLPTSRVTPARADGLQVVVWVVDRRVDPPTTRFTCPAAAPS